MWIEMATFAAGLVALTVGADLLVRGASKLALSFGISPLVIGLTVVALGTSAPEMAVSVGAVFNGTGDIAVGNVVGSNIANVLLILGLTAAIAPIAVADQIVRQEVPIMIAVSVLLTALAYDGVLARLEGALLLALLLAYLWLLIRQARRVSKARRAPADAAPTQAASGWDGHWGVQAGLVVGGLALLVFGADFLVGAAVTIARALGVSDLVIGLTVVAVGTSMPEIATSLLAALRGERDIAVGNVVGSNTFNVLGCLGLSALLAEPGIAVSEAARSFDLWVMLAVTCACLPIAITGREIARWEGCAFLGFYGAYLGYLVLTAKQHEALATFTATMTWVLPIAVVIITLSLLRHHRRLGRENGKGKGAGSKEP